MEKYKTSVLEYEDVQSAMRYMQLTFLICFIFSCNKNITNDHDGAEEIIIDAKHQNALSLDSIFKRVNFIRLETTEDNTIGEISQLLFTDTVFIVVDNRFAKNINVFDMNGQYKNSIGHMGNGPGEFAEISYVCLLPEKNVVAILDRMQHKINYYNVNGQYAYSESTPFMFVYYEYLANGKKAYYVGDCLHDPLFREYKENALIVSDKDNNIIYGACNDFYKAGQFHYMMHNPLRKFQDEIYFSPNYSNIIYLVTDSIIIPKYFINIVWNGMPPLTDQITDEKYDEYREKYHYFNGDMVELKDLSFINISTPFGNPFVIYSHANKQTFFSTDEGSHPLFPFLKDEAPKAQYGDNTVVFDIPAYHLMVNKEEWYKHEKDKDFLERLYGGLNEDSNPVLVFCELNEKIGYEE